MRLFVSIVPRFKILVICPLYLVEIDILIMATKKNWRLTAYQVRRRALIDLFNKKKEDEKLRHAIFSGKSKRRKIKVATEEDIAKGKLGCRKFTFPLKNEVFDRVRVKEVEREVILRMSADLERFNH